MFLLLKLLVLLIWKLVLKRLEQSGYVAISFSSMFDTDDEREIYLSDETEIFASDDEDTVRIKLMKQASYVKRF